MSTSFIPRKRRGKRSLSFNPSHEFIHGAVEEYLSKGGQITKVETVKPYYEGFVSVVERVSPADEFLMGN